MSPHVSEKCRVNTWHSHVLAEWTNTGPASGIVQKTEGRPFLFIVIEEKILNGNSQHLTRLKHHTVHDETKTRPASEYQAGCALK